MARQTINNGETGLTVRTKLNENFAEVYTLAEAGGGAGTPGLSAYQVAVAGGFVGDSTAWLASLVGPAGPAPTITAFTDEALFNAATPGADTLAVLYSA